jgi:branched-chain amino acid transport system permease protein
MNQKKIPIPVRYEINFLLFAAFLFVGSYLISAGVVSKYFAKVIVLIGINIILAVSLNVSTGYLGQLPLGHAGFMAVGAYASAIFMRGDGATPVSCRPHRTDFGRHLRASSASS